MAAEITTPERRPFGDVEQHIKTLFQHAPFRDIQHRFIDNALTRLKNAEPEMDADTFAQHKTALEASNPIRAILQVDAAVREYQKGDLIIRHGDYGHSAFFILQGQVRVVKNPPLTEEELGHQPKKSRHGVWQHIRTLFSQDLEPESRNVALYESDKVDYDPSTQHARLKTTVLEHVLADPARTETMSEGQHFGEIAALARTERTASIFSEGDAVLLEVRWQGLRALMQKDAIFKQEINKNYRDFGLKAYLRNHAPFNAKITTEETPADTQPVPTIWAELDPDMQDLLIQQTAFQTYGKLDWYTDKYESADTETVIIEEGSYAESLFMIRSGFARVSVKLAQGERTLAVLRRGDIFGLEEISHNHLNPDNRVGYQRSIRAIGYADVLVLPAYVVESTLIDRHPPTELPALFFPSVNQAVVSVGNDMMNFLIDHRFVNGTQTMLIDLARCTHCDDCVSACASVHNNNPRFIRQGKIHDQIMVANACMHCSDAVCMIGCPTGAIHRDSKAGWVVINDETCIGCHTCANSCPYDNIQMINVRDKHGHYIRDKNSKQPIQKATSCDLCIEHLHVSPACERACAHDALVRMDMSDSESLVRWLNR